MIACTSKKNSYTQEQLYEQTSSGVVLIQNTYYYKITLSNNGFYSTNYVFSKLQDGELKNISHTISNNFNEVNDTIKSTTFGTGFIISPRGTIVTNSHVINPTTNKNLIYQALIRYLKEQIDYCNQQLEETRNRLEIFEREIRDNKKLDSQGYAMMMEGIQSSRKWIDTFTQYRNNRIRDLSLSNFDVELCSEIKIAYNGSHITSSNDLIDCFVVKDVPNYDLGIIQIADANEFWNVCKLDDTPKWSCEPTHLGGYITYRNLYSDFMIPQDKYIFNLYNNETRNNEEIKLYMIGFNQGPTLALTNDGIKAQITQGYISQNTDSIKIMYSIPALQGSSGSPVVNQYGELVAINFAGINNTQGFNYGIRVERLREIVNDKSVKDRMTVRQSKNKHTNHDSINSIESINN
ncbi:S1 family peptidase [Bacteroides uniformis]|jgi:V8-like Glu-specific endopeptidase|uniref:S1 family peptidase n=2 Tax=Bacteroidaceae TaxID=815 RepID=UPI00233EEDE5|nr:trypsin-like peptidase domain-containing protein [Bacteroides uniformis]MBS4839165.1 trypsin-like peptidase domain-containing protein [Phocaeicola massiliensis]